MEFESIDSVLNKYYLKHYHLNCLKYFNLFTTGNYNITLLNYKSKSLGELKYFNKKLRIHITKRNSKNKTKRARNYKLHNILKKYMTVKQLKHVITKEQISEF